MAWNVEPFGEMLAERVLLVVGPLPSAPHVESEVDRGQTALGFDQQRPVVAKPDLVERQLDDVDRGPELRLGLGAETGHRDHDDGLELRDRPDRRDPTRLRERHELGRIGLVPGPGHEAPLVRLPFRRQARGD